VNGNTAAQAVGRRCRRAVFLILLTFAAFPTVIASLVNRSALRRAVFSRTAMAAASYSVVASAPSRARSSLFLNFASARARASFGLSTELSD
jgi:hypothetical protein